MDLFSQNPPKKGEAGSTVPLAERCRPKTLGDFVGHQKIVGSGTSLFESIKRNRLKSLILWGPPGVGKTTLARIISNEVKADFIAISAVTSGVADIRKTIEKAEYNHKYLSKPTILFIDEIHRFNKAQQDALLHVVEDGTIILIGATTENPSFEVISPLLSRCQVYQMLPLGNDEIRQIVEKALKNDALLIEKQIKIKDWETLYILADGDARRALNVIEKAVDLLENQPPPLKLTKEIFEKAALQKVLYYDKAGDYHYDLISAFIKSLRGSDPDAAVYWMARMLEAGEDPKFIARRMLILAAEDIGNADPYALIIATSCFTAVTYVGMPECQIILSQAATYLASAPKSNAAYKAIVEATEDVKNQPDIQVPLHLRNAPTGLMKRLDYGKDYKYSHNYEDHFIKENYLPKSFSGRIYYNPTTMGKEKELRERLKKLWSGMKEYPAEGTNKSEEQK
jgi:putative ATPase